MSHLALKVIHLEWRLWVRKVRNPAAQQKEMDKNTSAPNELIGVCVVLLDKNNKVLLGKRKNSYRSGYYGLPGGRVERNESLEESAKRELFEETGLKVKKLEYLGTVRDLQEDNHTFIHFAFLCNDFLGTPILAEPEKCEVWEWFKPSLIPTKTLPGHIAAVNMYVGGGKAHYMEVSSI